MTRIPGARRQPGHTLDLAIRLFPNLPQTPLIEQHRHIQRIPAGKREITAKHRNIDRRRNRIIIRLHRINRASLHRPEQLTGRHQLIREIQLDLHLAIGNLVERINRRLNHMLSQCRPSISLQTPRNLVLRPDHIRCRNRRRPGSHRRQPGILDK